MRAAIFHKFTLLSLLLSGVAVADVMAQTEKIKSDKKDSKVTIKVRVSEDENGKGKYREPATLIIPDRHFCEASSAQAALNQRRCDDVDHNQSDSSQFK